MSLLENLPHTIDLSRMTYGKGDYGGDVPTATAFVLAEPAWVQTASQDEIAEFQIDKIKVTHKIFLRRDPGLQLDDDILIHGGQYSGTHMKAKSWAEATAGIGLLWKLFAEINRETQA